MKHDEFIGQVQHHARLSSWGEAVVATRATLEALAERLAGGEAKDLASKLPRGIAEYLHTGAFTRDVRASTGVRDELGLRRTVGAVLPATRNGGGPALVPFTGNRESGGYLLLCHDDRGFPFSLYF